MLPEEKFIDRRIATIDDVLIESDSDGYEDIAPGGAPGGSDPVEQLSNGQ
jgi:hypothetical protein